jgi:hypothetical protein
VYLSSRIQGIWQMKPSPTTRPSTCLAIKIAHQYDQFTLPKSNNMVVHDYRSESLVPFSECSSDRQPQCC